MGDSETKQGNSFEDLVKAVEEKPEVSSSAKLKHCLMHYQGYRGRVLSEKCPYPENSREFYSWHLGWNLAHRELTNKQVERAQKNEG